LVLFAYFEPWFSTFSQAEIFFFMRFRNLISLTSFALILLSGCSSSKKVTGVWVNKEKQRTAPYPSVFVVALTADPEIRVAVENSVAATASTRGIRVVKSIDVINIDIKNPRLVTRDEVTTMAKENNCEGILVSAMLDKDESIRYTAGTTTYAPTTYYSWNGYYNNLTSVSKPGYYSKDKTYFMETRMFDSQSEELMWSAQSKVFSPSSLKTFCNSYISTLLDQLKEEGVIKK
jgi:hypothetical protein